MLGVAVMIRDKYAVRLAPEQREELQNLTGWEKLRPSDRQGAFSSRATMVGPLPRWPRP